MTAMAPIPEIDVHELRHLLQTEVDLILLDVREPHEWEIASIPGTTHRIPLNALDQRRDEISPDRRCVVYCRSGRRSQTAIQILHDGGITTPANLKGGILAWARELEPDMETY